MSDLELALKKHKYVTEPGGKPKVNVTTLSGLLDINGKSSAFAGAAVRITREGGDYRQQWKEAGEIGTRVHGYIENFLLGKAIEYRDDEKGFVDAAEKFIVELDPQPIIPPEFVVVSPHGYGGRGDMAVSIDPLLISPECEGWRWLIDAKSGKERAIDHTIQLALLRFAELAQFDGKGMLIGSEPMPEFDHTGCLYVASDGTYSLVEYPADEEAFAVGLGLLFAYNWANNAPMKELANAWRKK